MTSYKRYACKKMDHIVKFCQTWLEPEEECIIQQQLFNNTKSTLYEKVEKLVLDYKQRLSVHLSCGHIDSSKQRKDEVEIIQCLEIHRTRKKQAQSIVVDGLIEMHKLTVLE